MIFLYLCLSGNETFRTTTFCDIAHQTKRKAILINIESEDLHTPIDSAGTVVLSVLLITIFSLCREQKTPYDGGFWWLH
jgi:hypothetical protein